MILSLISCFSNGSSQSHHPGCMVKDSCLSHHPGCMVRNSFKSLFLSPYRMYGERETLDIKLKQEVNDKITIKADEYKTVKKCIYDT